MCSPEEMLLYMVDQENEEVVQTLVKTGIDLNYRNMEGFTPLLCAAEKGNIKIVKMLLDHGADCNYTGRLSDGNLGSGDPVIVWTPLFNAALYGHPEVMKLLIKHGANVDFRDERGRTALNTALQRGHKECVEILIENGAKHASEDIALSAYFEINIKKIERERREKERKIPKEHNVKKSKSDVPLHSAASENNRDSVHDLIRNGVDINYKDKRGNTALHIAMENGNVDCARLLMKKGASVRLKGHNGNTVLHIAASLGKYSIIAELVERGGEVEARNNDDLTPLSFAVFHDHPLCVKQLLNYGSKVNTRFDEGKTALHVAVSKSIDCIDILLKQNADIFAQNEEGICPLELAVDQGMKYFKKLCPGKLSISNSEGVTPLHYAARSCKKDSLEYMIREGCNVNIQTRNGDTPLHFACMFDHIAFAAKSLLEGTPFRDHPSNVDVLLDAGADIKKKNKYGLAPVHIAALKGAVITLGVLKDRGADLNLRGGKKKQTPLHIASELGAYKCIKFLLNNGADKNAVDADKCTALMLSAKKAHFSCVKLLLEYDALLWAN